MKQFGWPVFGGEWGDGVTVTSATTATMTSPDAWPTTGSTVTVTKGTIDGAPVSGVLTLAGATVSGTDSGPTLTYVVPAGGTTERALVWTPESGAPVSMTVYPVLKSQALHYFGASNPISGTPGAITGLTSEGTYPLTMAIAGTGAAPSIGGFGIVSGGGQYLNCTNESTTAFAGEIILLRHNYTSAMAPPSGTRHWLELTSTRGHLAASMSTSGSYLSLSDGTVQCETPLELERDRSILMGWEVDYEGGRTRSIGGDGVIGPLVSHNVFATTLLDSIRLLRNMTAAQAGAEMEAWVFARTPGGSFPDTLERLWHRIAQKPLTVYGTAATLLTNFGASNNIVSGVVDSAANREYNIRGHARMPTGMALVGGGAVTSINGPGFTEINRSVPATWGKAKVSGTYGSLYGALATLNAHSQRQARYVMAMGYAAIGRVIGDFDDDAGTGTGTLIPELNGQYIIEEAARLATAQGLTLGEIICVIFQGGADANVGATYAQYDTELRGAIADLQANAALVGATVKIWLVQMNGQRDTTSFTNGILPPSDVQVDIADEIGAILLPSSPYSTKDGLHLDNSINALSEAFSWLQGQKDAGNPVPNATPSAALAGGTITVTIPRRADLALSRDVGKYPQGGIANAGFEVEGGGSITGLSIANSGANATITLTTTGTVTAVRYMHQSQDVSALADAFVARRGELYFETGITALVNGGTIRLPIPSFRVVF